MNYKYFLSLLLLTLFSFSVNGQGETQKDYNTFKIAAKVNSSFAFDFKPNIYSMDELWLLGSVQQNDKFSLSLFLLVCFKLKLVWEYRFSNG